MPYSASKVAPTDEEWAILRRETKPAYAAIGFIIVFFGFGLSFLLWSLFGWAGGWFSDDMGKFLRYLGLTIGLLLCCYVTASFLRFDRRQRRIAGEDLEEGRIEVLDVRPAALAKIALINDNEPVLCFQISDDELLYLQGQYMYDPHIYGQQDEPDEEYERSVNGLSGGRAFPNTHFKLRRLPRLGRVLSIELLGEELEYGEEADVLKPEYLFPESLIISGTLDTLAESLAEAHTAWQAG